MACPDTTCMLDDEQHRFVDDESPLQSAYMGTGIIPEPEDMEAIWDRIIATPKNGKEWRLPKCRPARRRTKVKWWIQDLLWRLGWTR